MGLPGVEVIEQAGLRGWPGLESEFDGTWIRRAANGYTKRANSVQCLDPTDGDNAPARIAASKAWFEDRGLQPVFRITPLASPRLVDALNEAGWDSIDHSHLFAMELNSMPFDPRGEIYDLLEPAFLAVQQRLQGYSDETLGKLRAVLALIEAPAGGVVLYSPEGEPVASSLMGIVDGIVLTGNVVTDKTQRRKGYGAAMMRSGLAWATDAGAKVAALNVAADNPAGQALYRSLGYRRQYDYTYRTPGAA